MGKLGQRGGMPGPGIGGSGPMMGTIIDGWVLPEQPTKIYADGRQQKVGLMIGNNSQEFQGMMGGRGATSPPDIRQMISQR
jgi:carboxylesterase type B